MLGKHDKQHPNYNFADTLSMNYTGKNNQHKIEKFFLQKKW